MTEAFCPAFYFLANGLADLDFPTERSPTKILIGFFFLPNPSLSNTTEEMKSEDHKKYLKYEIEIKTTYHLILPLKA